MIGGQALIEGILMRGVDRQAIVCRKSDGTLVSRVDPLKLSKDKHPWMGYPFIRGVVNFLDSMVNGVKAITWSAEQQPEDEQGEPDKFDLWIQKHFSDETAEKIILYTAVVLGIALSVGLFALLPTFLAGLLNRLVPLGVWRGLAEGIFRLAIFLGYLKLCSMIPDMKRVWMYHGAEHKTITCYEKGLDLTVENVKKCRRVHDRCGTTFMFFVMFVSILVYSVFGAIFPVLNENVGLKMLSRIVLLPLIAGLSYELLKLLAKTDSPLVLPLKAPGLLLQMLTTKEPDEQMMEVAIAAFEKVLKMDEDPNEPVCKFVCPEKVSVVTENLKKKFRSSSVDETDAEWIVSIVTGIKRSELGGDSRVKSSHIDKIDELAAERIKGKPLSYVLGNADFYG